MLGKNCIYCIGILWLAACSSPKTEVAWEQNFPGIGSQSSPRAVDLNGDGIDDLVMGACKNEYIPTDHGVIALDGKSGNLLWKSDAPDQVFGSPTILDINEDKQPDIIIAGRWGYLRALNGSNGKTIWNYNYKDSLDPILKYAKFNFYNSVLIPDQNNDGTEDVLIQNGGNHKADPDSDSARYPGLLMIIDSKTGYVLAADTIPDGKETYCSPIYIPSPNEQIIYGSGGETFNGQLFVCTIKDLINKNLKSSKIIVTDTLGHGFISPPIAIDINMDGVKDIASISHSSIITVTDGESLTTLWQTKIPNTESSNGLAIGFFNADKTPDVFALVSMGVWPQSTNQVLVALDGKNGKIIYSDTLGCAGFSSPIVYDLNNDDIDEVLLSINEYNCDRGYSSLEKLEITNKLVALDIKNKKIQEIERAPQFKNIYSTPLITDLDHDGYLDIIYSQFYNATNDLIPDRSIEQENSNDGH